MCSLFQIESYRFQAHLPVFGLHGEIDVGPFEVRTVELTPSKLGIAVDRRVLVVTKVLTAGGCIWNHNMN